MTSKHPGGRPLKFQDKDELERKINDFWTYVEEKKVHPTISRLAVFLDCHRETLLNYEEKDEFFDTIRKTKARIHSATEESLFNRNVPVAGVIFNMVNNWGWKNRQDVDQKMSGNMTVVTKVPESEHGGGA